MSIASTLQEPDSALPIVAQANQSNWGMWGFFALLGVGGVMLFNALSASEQEDSGPSITEPASSNTARIASPPPLVIPPAFFSEPAAQARPAPAETIRRAAPPQPIRREVVLPAPIVDWEPRTPPPAPVAQAQSQSDTPQVVYEQRNTPSAAAASLKEEGGTARVTASRFLNPGLTIPQGTVIQAVLETALDSTRPGGVRALVQRDVSSFDGTRVLIPRGSRLYGEYQANLQRGQNRALVQWSRLIRPDGVTINLDSPSSDPLGRAGIRGKVDSKFLQRFGSALLQSIVDLGINVAVSEATDGVIVALPGSTQNVQVADQQAFQPTLKVKHGTSVSVFVARDLDFSTVES